MNVTFYQWSGETPIYLQSKQTLHLQLFQQYGAHVTYTFDIVHRGPNLNHLAIDKMSHSYKADVPAICHKEDMHIDKEYINGNADLPLELCQFPRNLH